MKIKYINIFIVIWLYFIFKYTFNFNGIIKCSELINYIVGAYPIKIYGFINYHIINDMLSSLKINPIYNQICFYNHVSNYIFPRKHPLSYPHLLLFYNYYNNDMYHLSLQFSSSNYNNNFTLLNSYNLNLLRYNQYISSHFRIINISNLTTNVYPPQYNVYTNNQENQKILNKIIYDNLLKHKIF